MIVSVVFVSEAGRGLGLETYGSQAIAAETCTFLRLQYVIGYLKDEGKFAAGYGKMRQYDFAQELLWALAYATFELSIGFFFLQIASRTRQVVYKRMVIGSMGKSPSTWSRLANPANASSVVVGLYNAGFIMVSVAARRWAMSHARTDISQFTFFICHPLATYWSLTDWSCVADGTRSGMDVAHSGMGTAHSFSGIQLTFEVVSATLELMFSTLIPVRTDPDPFNPELS